ncbi:MAG: BolA/IbaG family iron-sulfur metabolism protein [Ectothiorhodospiraceae bacterium AqS1]|nr:BolA/IbaG family iron-sulfur metabolism protein [Ectothiorhodospiraceae bacterium AqS1]
MDEESGVEAEEIEELIRQGLDCIHVRVGGDGRHFDAVVVSKAFEGKPMLKRHRMVYRTLGSRFDDERLHALALRTMTPDQWRSLGAGDDI